MKVKLYKLLIRHYEQTREHASLTQQAAIDALLSVKSDIRVKPRRENKRIIREAQAAAKRRGQARLLATMDFAQAAAYMHAQKPRLKPYNVRRWPEWKELELDYPLSHTRRRPGPEVMLELKEQLDAAHRISLPTSREEGTEGGEEVPTRQNLRNYSPEWEE